jgi:hypothetical protein
VRRVLLVAFVAASVNVVTTESAKASEILFLAPQLPCFGTTLPLTCFGGGPGFPIVWQGPNYVPIDIPANSLIEKIDLWGLDTEAVGIWDSTTQPSPFPPPPFPGHELAAIRRDSIDYTITLFGRDGIDGTPYFFFQGTLDDPIFLQNGGRYYVGVAGFGMVGSGPDVAWRTVAFSPEASVLFPRNPGVAIQVVGQVVPEPSTIVLFGLGLMLLYLRRLPVRSSAR